MPAHPPPWIGNYCDGEGVLRQNSRMCKSKSMACVLVLAAQAAGAKVTFDENGVLQIDGKKTFVISFAMPPPPGGKTPEGKDGLTELHEAGATFARIAPDRRFTRKELGD